MGWDGLAWHSIAIGVLEISLLGYHDMTDDYEETRGSTEYLRIAM